MSIDIITIAQNLLGRRLTAGDGLPCTAIEQAEQALSIVIPAPLKELYVLIGNLPLFMSSFQHIYQPGRLRLLGNKLVFMEENQHVCYWAVNKDEESMPVYQSTSIENDQWHEEEINLPDFLALILYYQYVQANGYRQHTVDSRNLNPLIENCTKVADHNGLVIYDHPQKVVWYFSDEYGKPAEEIYETGKDIDTTGICIPQI